MLHTPRKQHKHKHKHKQTNKTWLSYVQNKAQKSRTVQDTSQDKTTPKHEQLRPVVSTYCQ